MMVTTICSRVTWACGASSSTDKPRMILWLTIQAIASRANGDTLPLSLNLSSVDPVASFF
ncbi:hypothetical protein DFP94_108113 [Fontibacillus phaseoli]|uniref:Uncharacterized protein n=1 Tax=Fontibacillus phaseoli TaxID=1416533 RepID=A0A369B898_9BACL|nr:hypothetical protein DFP94_108113 [Fontibacillus phaseoli]